MITSTPLDAPIHNALDDPTCDVLALLVVDKGPDLTTERSNLQIKKDLVQP